MLQAAFLLDIRLLDEPTAAAHAYLLVNRQRLQKLESGTEYIAVFDFGGGTFDVSIVAIERAKGKSALRVVHSDGIGELGGEELDVALIRHYLDVAQVSKQARELIECNIHELNELVARRFSERDVRADVERKTKSLKRLLKGEAERNKIALSLMKQEAVQRNASANDVSLPADIKIKVDIEFEEPLPGGEHREVEFELQWSELARILTPVVQRTVEKFCDVVSVAESREHDNGREFKLSRVLLVGKSSRLPLVRELLLAEPALSEGGAVLDDSLRGQEKVCVARGASYYGTRVKQQAHAGIAEGSTRVLTRSIGVIREEDDAAIFDPLSELERGRTFDPATGVLKGILRVRYGPYGCLCIAENAGTSRELELGGVVNPEITRIGMFSWRSGVLGDVGDKIDIAFRLDANGILTVRGIYREQPIGQYSPLALTLAERPVYFFI